MRIMYVGFSLYTLCAVIKIAVIKERHGAARFIVFKGKAGLIVLIFLFVAFI